MSNHDQWILRVALERMYSTKKNNKKLQKLMTMIIVTFQIHVQTPNVLDYLFCLMHVTCSALISVYVVLTAYLLLYQIVCILYTVKVVYH